MDGLVMADVSFANRKLTDVLTSSCGALEFNWNRDHAHILEEGMHVIHVIFRSHVRPMKCNS